MHRFLVDSEIENGLVRLSREEALHALKVLRLKNGDPVEAMDGKGGAWAGTLVTDGYTCQIKLGERLISTDAPINLTLYMGLPKGEKLELIAQKLTELGAIRIVPVRMERCVMKIQPAESEKKLSRPRRISKEAQKQSGRQTEMEISDPIDFVEMSDLLKAHDRTFLLWENAKNNRLYDEKRVHPTLKNIAYIVGPEGGISEAEAETCVSLGAVPITLGPRILRAETAAIAGCAEIMALWGDL